MIKNVGGVVDFERRKDDNIAFGQAVNIVLNRVGDISNESKDVILDRILLVFELIKKARRRCLNR